MSLISNRPAYWNEVVGQQRVQRVLAGVLKHPEYMTRGFIFSGVEGLGKTTVAYLFAKLLMCQSNNPYTCTDCPSCQSFAYDAYGNLQHPDFEEVDAASFSGVAAARGILSNSDQGTRVGKRQVILIDEAHRLSAEAWDVYLKPLEIAHTGAVFLFSTNDAREIPKTIVSRCTFLQFSLVPREQILGRLMSIADGEKLPYTLDGLRHIAEMAHGRIRMAVNMLQTVAVTGSVTPENCALALTESLLDTATKVLERLAEMVRPQARHEDLMVDVLKLADEAAQVSGPALLIQTLFQVYARAFFENSGIAQAFPEFKAVTAVFLKWTRTQQIPVDVIPLFLMELVELLPGRTSVLAQPEQRQVIRRRAMQSNLIQDNTTQAKPEVPSEMSLDELSRLIGATS